MERGKDTLICGDLNFCFLECERLSRQGTVGGNICKNSGDAWNNHIGKDFVEFEQPDFTCRHSFGWSKIDKMFNNFHHARLANYELRCNTIRNPTQLSDHYPISAGIKQSGKSGCKFPDWVLAAENFNEEFYGFLGFGEVDPCADPFESYQQTVQAGYQAAKFVTFEQKTRQPETTAHKLAITANYIKAKESGNMVRVGELQTIYPYLLDPYENVLEHFSMLEGELFAEKTRLEEERQRKLVELGLTDVEPNHCNTNLDMLYKIGNGGFSGVSAVQDRDGNIFTDDRNIARVLCSEWSEVFSEKPIDLEGAAALVGGQQLSSM